MFIDFFISFLYRRKRNESLQVCSKLCWVISRRSVKKRGTYTVKSNNWIGKSKTQKKKSKKYRNPFLANVPISYSLKTPGNLWFSSVFREYKMGTLARIGLIAEEEESFLLLSNISQHSLWNFLNETFFDFLPPRILNSNPHLNSNVSKVDIFFSALSWRLLRRSDNSKKA